jgi:cell wall assembly regulator SMI1
MRAVKRHEEELDRHICPTTMRAVKRHEEELDRHIWPTTMRAVKRHEAESDTSNPATTMHAVKRRSDDFLEQAFQFLLLRGGEPPETLVELPRQRRHASGRDFAPRRGE